MLFTGAKQHQNLVFHTFRCVSSQSGAAVHLKRIHGFDQPDCPNRQKVFHLIISILILFYDMGHQP